MPPHILAVFNQLYEELKSMKQQQWTITNYGALILAAIYAVKHQLPVEVTHLQSKLKFLAILAIATAVLGLGFLVWVQRNIVQTRLRLDDLHYNFFTSNELRGVGWTDEQIRRLQDRPWRHKDHWLRGLEFTVPLILVLWVGAILVCLAL